MQEQEEGSKEQGHPTLWERALLAKLYLLRNEGPFLSPRREDHQVKLLLIFTFAIFASLREPFILPV